MSSVLERFFIKTLKKLILNKITINQLTNL